MSDGYFVQDWTASQDANMKSKLRSCCRDGEFISWHSGSKDPFGESSQANNIDGSRNITFIHHHTFWNNSRLPKANGTSSSCALSQYMPINWHNPSLSLDWNPHILNRTFTSKTPTSFLFCFIMFYHAPFILFFSIYSIPLSLRSILLYFVLLHPIIIHSLLLCSNLFCSVFSAAHHVPSCIHICIQAPLANH